MAFRPERPTASDYQAPIAPFILDAIPGARDKDDAATTAHAALTEASTKALAASRKFHDLGGPNGPRATVKRAAWDKADDDARATATARDVAERIYDRATRARFEFVYDAMDEPAFAEKIEPLFGEASRRASEALDALKLALTERDEFLSALGRVLDVDGGNWGLREALRNVAAYVDAGLVDEEAVAWAIVTDALDAGMLMAGDRARVLTDANAVRTDKALSVGEKADRYRAILARHRISSRRVIR